MHIPVWKIGCVTRASFNITCANNFQLNINILLFCAPIILFRILQKRNFKRLECPLFNSLPFKFLSSLKFRLRDLLTTGQFLHKRALVYTSLHEFFVPFSVRNKSVEIYTA